MSLLETILDKEIKSQPTITTNNNNDKINTVRYNDIYNKLLSYGVHNTLNEEIAFKYNYYHTNVILGNDLHSLYNLVQNYEKRDCYKLLQQYIWFI